jgi:hypothetical protein
MMSKQLQLALAVSEATLPIIERLSTVQQTVIIFTANSQCLKFTVKDGKPHRTQPKQPKPTRCVSHCQKVLML